MSGRELDSVVLEYQRTKDPRLGQRIWAAMQDSIQAKAKKLVMYDPKRLTVEDLTQEAWFGILLAVRKFDPKRRVRFTTFAAAHVIGKMLDAVRYPRRKNVPNTPVYMSPLPHDSDNGKHHPSMFDLAVDDRSEGPCEQVERSLLMDDLMACVNYRERLMFQLMYCEQMTMKEVGKVMGLSESRVCQMHKDALACLRERWRLREEDLCSIRG